MKGRYEKVWEKRKGIKREKGERTRKSKRGRYVEVSGRKGNKGKKTLNWKLRNRKRKMKSRGQEKGST